MNLRAAFSSLAGLLNQPEQPSDLFARTASVADSYSLARSLTRPPDDITAALSVFRQPLYFHSSFRPSKRHSNDLDDPHRDDRDELFGASFESVVYVRNVVNDLSYIVIHTPRNATHIEHIIVELFTNVGKPKYNRRETTLDKIADDAPEAGPIIKFTPDFRLYDIRDAAQGIPVVVEMQRGQQVRRVDIAHDVYRQV